MSRRKARKPRRQRPQGKVTVRIEMASGATVEVVLPDCTSDHYRQAQARAQAGDFRAPEIWHVVKALSAAVGHDLDPRMWADADFLKVLSYLGLVDVGEWSAADDAAVAALLRGEGAGGGR
ncbi:hypothetical protein [Streptomyces sp. NPDC005486]|uniref:hypothetical protein n=1 Tax=Streptomyces sp. NPDC005486 TaxID=3155345 RepID=UPI0033A9FE90